MTKMPLVTVIMPVYNTELYVSDAVSSILQQSMSDLELICIDDGSTDRSREICEAFAAEDERVTVICQANSGQGTARNKALKKANGRFVYFMDSDDILSSVALEEICKEMISRQLDLLFFEAHCFGEIGKTNAYKRKGVYDDVYAGPDLANLLLKNDEFIVSPCLYVASADLYRKNDIRFLERVKHEDDIATILVLLNSKRATCFHWDFYARRYRPGSTMTSFNPEASTKGAFRTYCDLWQRRKAVTASGVLRSAAADAFLERCKYETVRLFSHCRVPVDRFFEVVGCQNESEFKAADEILRAISDMGFRFYLERGLRLIKRKLLEGSRR